MRYLAFEGLFEKLCSLNTDCGINLILGGLIDKGVAHLLAILEFSTSCIDSRDTYKYIYMFRRTIISHDL